MTQNIPPNTPSQVPRAIDTSVKQLPFAFPFLKKGRGTSEASTRFTDEHDIYRLLAEREPSGSYLVSRTGMWHSGIHITEAGAGQALDLDAGVLCIANGQVIAYRINRTYPVSEVSAPGGEATVLAPYSTGFTLVRHTMEFPKGVPLTFYSLYMHLQAYDDYANDPKRQKPAYWSTQFQVTGFAQDTPATGRNGQVACADQQGLRVRRSHPHGRVAGILPQGASVSIGTREKGWGQIRDMHGSSLYPPVAGGFVAPSAAIGGWIFLGNENGGPLVREVMPDASFDRVVFPSSTASQSGGQDPGVPIKAGDLIGHLGSYDSLNQCATGTRMVHIEVFCDDSIETFIDQGRAWVEEHGPHPNDWAALGLPAEPTILRISPKTTLYQQQNQEGVDAPLTDVIQVYSLAELGRDRNRQVTESQPDARLGRKVSWWHVESANALGNPIDGWVREYNHAGGRVTREFAQKWGDFQCLADACDPAHTIFVTNTAWADYASGANVPAAAALAKLSPLMQRVYRALFAKGDGSHAADDLCHVGSGNPGHYPWLMQASSRLIAKHESEWANPGKWKQLIAELEKETGPKPQHVEELKRIDRLTWWDEVRAGVPGFPGPEVFHIHPIGLVGNFLIGQTPCECGCCLQDVFKVTRYGHAPHTHYGPVFWGEISLEKSKVLADMRVSGAIAEGEYRIIVAMSKNEGMLDAVQAYDSEAVTAGAMQKTINPQGKGEFPTQVAEFKASNASEYHELFEKCGWTVEGAGPDAQMFYTHPELTQGQKITAGPLKDLMRQGCSDANFGRIVKNVPLAVIANAITSKSFETKQLMDFLTRLRKMVLPSIPRGYHYTVAQYFQSDLGRAAALDQSVNRPGYMTRDIGKSLDAMFFRHPGLSRNPEEWGTNRSQYEQEVVNHYGNNREMSRDSNGLNSASRRFGNLISKLG